MTYVINYVLITIEGPTAASVVTYLVLGLIWYTPSRVVRIVMAFGVGVLINAVALELVKEAFDTSGALPLVGA